MYGQELVPTPALSPKVKTSQQVGLIEVKLEYSRPSIRGRKIFGGLVPFEKHWRTGANAATKLGLTGNIVIGKDTIPKGDYAILTLPKPDSWDVLLYPYDGGNWGDYTQKDPLVKVTLPTSKLAEPRETFLIDVNNLSHNSATLDFSWENTLVSLPFTLDTRDLVMDKVDTFLKDPMGSVGNTYYQIATYLFQEKTKLEDALGYAEKAGELVPKYWVYWTHAQILAELGKFKEAYKKGTQVLEEAKKMGSDSFVDANKALIEGWKNTKNKSDK